MSGEKSARHHSDDGEFFAIEHQVPSDDSAIAAEATRPEIVTQHDDVRVPRFRIVRPERSAEHRRGAEEREKLRRDHRGANTLRLFATGKIGLPAARAGHGGEDRILRLPNR